MVEVVLSKKKKRNYELINNTYVLYRSDTIVLVSRYDLFEYSGGEPDPKYLTMLRALEVCCLGYVIS